MPADPAHRLAVARALQLGAAVLLFAGIPSCAYYDKGYQQLAATAEANPPKDAIVGMWHRRRGGAAVPTVMAKWRMNLLFNRDGTGLAESWVHNGVWSQEVAGELGQFKWSYAGNGVWNMQSLKDSSRVDQCRISDGTLLRQYNWTGAWNFWVYERVKP